MSHSAGGGSHTGEQIFTSTTSPEVETRADAAELPRLHGEDLPAGQEAEAAAADRDPGAREREICELAWIVATEHVYNILNHGLNIGSDGFCELREQQNPVVAERPGASV